MHKDQLVVLFFPESLIVAIEVGMLPSPGYIGISEILETIPDFQQIAPVCGCLSFRFKHREN